MEARQYNRKIEIWRKEFATDQYGGIHETDLFVKSIWSKITTNVGNKFSDFGIQDFKNPVIFSVRGRKNNIVYDENYNIQYKGKTYFVKGYQNNLLDDMELIIYTDSE